MSFDHHIKALPPALRAMQAFGYDSAACLQGTDLREEDLTRAPAHFTLGQEYRFHRNLLQLTGDPLLGLKMGQAYTLETYGLFGYAFMSAPTLRQAMLVSANYGPLTFTLFRIAFRVKGNVAELLFGRGEPIPEDLLAYYIDRDLSAARFGGESALATRFELQRVELMHDGQGRRDAYRDYFQCDVGFNAPQGAMQFQASILDRVMPLGDAETSSLCLQQCQMLLARLSDRSGLAERVRQVIVARPGYFPDIDFVAEKLRLTTRTMRRRLASEGTSYQQILSEVRYGLAQEYLANSTLPVEEIAALLGYSAPGNFTNAFKRWHGGSPREFRRQQSVSEKHT